jgi:hypothetical protein
VTVESLDRAAGPWEPLGVYDVELNNYLFRHVQQMRDFGHRFRLTKLVLNMWRLPWTPAQLRLHFADAYFAHGKFRLPGHGYPSDITTAKLASLPRNDVHPFPRASIDDAEMEADAELAREQREHDDLEQRSLWMALH